MKLTPRGYRKRLVEKQFDQILDAMGGIAVEGPKWCGKTWTCLSRSESAFMVADTNEFGQSNREIAELNIRSCLDGERPRLIDEWQDVPNIWDAVRSDIDRNPGAGRYILTGSSTPRAVRPLHGGAGRIGRINMRTMSLFESGDSDGTVSLNDIVSGKDITSSDNRITLEGLVELVVCGGWPGMLGLDYDKKKTMVDNYLETVIHDASEMDGIHRNGSNVRLVLKSLARNECTLASLSKIRNDTGITQHNAGNTGPKLSYVTVADYVDVFDRMHLISNQPAFDPNMKSSIRVGKTAKRHFVDPSLAVAALGIGKERLMGDLKTFGCMFESLCERDLQIYSEHNGGRLSHYRDANGREIDAIVEMPNGEWGAFEIKLGWSQVDAAAESLLKFEKTLVKHDAASVPNSLCVICGLTATSYRREDGVYVVPITSLRP